jgi:hypothetical protein
MNPSIRLPLSAFSRRPWSFLENLVVAFAVLARLQGSVGSWYVCSQNLGSNGYRVVRGVLLPQGNGLVHHPTA